jgi:hypothetical protein
MSLWFQQSRNFRRGDHRDPIGGEAAFGACHAAGLSLQGRPVVNDLSDRVVNTPLPDAGPGAEAGRIAPP